MFFKYYCGSFREIVRGEISTPDPVLYRKRGDLGNSGTVIPVTIANITKTEK